MPQSVWCRITRCPLLGGWPRPSRPSRAHERSVAGVIRPPMLRITTPSPSSRPSTSLGSTRESTQPSTCRVSLVGKGRPANAPVAANAALRRTSSPEEMTMSGAYPSPHVRAFTCIDEGLGEVALCGLVVVLSVARCLRTVGYCAVASSGGPELDGDFTREHHARLDHPE